MRHFHLKDLECDWYSIPHNNNKTPWHWAGLSENLLGLKSLGKKPEIWVFIWSARLPPSQGGIRPHLKSGSHRLTQRILVFTNLFGLYLETWVHCWCHGFLGVVMFLWWFHVVLLGICKRILKKHIVIKGVELCWKKEETTCIFDIGKVPSGLLQLGNVQLGIWGRSWGNTLPYQFRQNLSSLDLFYIYKIRIATIFNQSIFQQTNQLRKTSVLQPLDLVKRRNFKQRLVFSWIPPLSC